MAKYYYDFQIKVVKHYLNGGIDTLSKTKGTPLMNKIYKKEKVNEITRTRIRILK